MEERLDSLMFNIFTTHTFGGVKYWRGGHRYPYRNILFEDKHLYSDKYRAVHKMFEPGEPERHMPAAREVELDNYVFAYLGQHEHYYSSYDGFNTPPFGIFVSRELDETNTTVATRYDLASPRASENGWANFYKNPYEARKDSISRIRSEFGGNFFHYWSSRDYVQKKFFDIESWKWKIEFHYRDMISILQIDALLWPIPFVASRDPENGTVFQPDAEYERYRRQFLEDPLHSKIKVYAFPWDADTSVERFCYASFLVTRYFHDHDRLPDERHFMEEFAQLYSVI